MEKKRLPDEITVGQTYAPAMKITDQKEADEYFELLVERQMRVGGESREEAERIQRLNLGYYAGYYDAETMHRVNRLFKTKHPYFGDTTPTWEEAFKMGMDLAKKHKKEVK